MLQLRVITPQGVFLEQRVDEVRATGVLGEFGVLPGHRPFVSALRSGPVLWRAGTAQGSLHTEAGFFKVNGQGEVSILVQMAQHL